MEGHCLTGHSPQWAVVPMEDEVLGVRRWRELVADRKKWKDVVRQATAHSGLYCQWKMKKNITAIQTKTKIMSQQDFRTVISEMCKQFPI